MESYSESIVSYLTPETKARLVAEAQIEQRSQAAIVRIALKAYLDQRRNERAAKNKGATSDPGRR